MFVVRIIARVVYDVLGLWWLFGVIGVLVLISAIIGGDTENVLPGILALGASPVMYALRRMGKETFEPEKMKGQ